MQLDDLIEKLKRQEKVCGKQMNQFESNGFRSLEDDIEFIEVAWEQYMINKKLIQITLKKLEDYERCISRHGKVQG